ncbi:MAG: hypothetical protein QOD77_957 [Thermoplasmata archaeon]|jgi:hypothetical protein|nr:hypothetical protein [Thermoplasmata archaeon]
MSVALVGGPSEASAPLDAGESLGGGAPRRGMLPYPRTPSRAYP